MSEKIFKGSISIGRGSSHEGHHMAIDLRDEASRTTVVRIMLSMEEFGNAISGLTTPVEFKCGNLTNIGKTMEVKVETIEYTQGVYGKEFTKMMFNLVSPFEVDGWKADVSDIKTHNHHKSVYKNGKWYYTVVFRRYV